MPPTTEQVLTLSRTGLAADLIAARLGCSLSTVRRLMMDGARSPVAKRIGRPALYDGDDVPEDFIGRVARRANEAATRPGLVELPLHIFAAAMEDPTALDPGLHQRIMRDGGRGLPDALMRRIRERIPSSTQQWVRGPKARKLFLSTTRRSLAYRDWEGVTAALRAHDVITADDAHFNQGFFHVCPDPVDRCAERFGVRACRAQNLVFADVATGRIIYQAIVLRYTDAYNQRDIRWVLARLLRRFGLPRLWLHLEHGAWASKELVESCRMVGLDVRFASSAKGKSLIEGKFNIHQKLVAGLAPGLNLGRTRDFDFAQKTWCDIRAGRLHPKDAGYLPVEDFFSVAERAWQLVNARKMCGDLYHWVPDEKWEAQMAEDVAQSRAPRAITDRDFAQMLPERRKVCVGTTQHGHVVLHCAEAGEDSLSFRADWMDALDRGYEVTVCFDPLEPDRAAIFNAERGARAVTRGFLCERDAALRAQWETPQLTQGLADGEFIGWARAVDRVPMFNDHLASLRSSMAERKSRRAYVRRMASAVAKFGAKADELRTDEWQDGSGKAARVEAPSRLKLSAATPNLFRGTPDVQQAPPRLPIKKDGEAIRGGMPTLLERITGERF
jgi:hypothetical protein